MHKINQNANITSDLLSKYPKTRVLKNTHYYVLPNRERENMHNKHKYANYETFIEHVTMYLLHPNPSSSRATTAALPGSKRAQTRGRKRLQHHNNPSKCRLDPAHTRLC